MLQLYLPSDTITIRKRVGYFSYTCTNFRKQVTEQTLYDLIKQEIDNGINTK